MGPLAPLSGSLSGYRALYDRALAHTLQTRPRRTSYTLALTNCGLEAASQLRSETSVSASSYVVGQ
jgi:hypothetical protein